MKTCIVKRKFTPKALFPSFAVLGIGFIAMLLLFKASTVAALLVLGIAAIAGALIAPSFIFTEYEYNLEGEVFSVALIRNKASRKELFSCDIAHLVTCEKFTGQPLGGIKLDYSEGAEPYCAVFNEEGKQAAIIFSPDDAFVRELFLLSPSKVKRNIM